MTKPWILVEKDRIDALDSGVGLIGDGNFYGSGKTFSYSKYILENNSNNLILSDSHILLDELYVGIDHITNINKFITYPLWGKKFIFSDFQQELYNKPKCLCNLYFDSQLFSLGKLGWWTDGFCKKCTHYYECRHKRNNKGLFNISGYKINKLIMAPKSYIYTELIDNIMSKFNKLILILDENLFNTMYRQFNLNSDAITGFNRFVQRMIVFNKDLRGFYKDFKEILKAISNAINFGVDKTEINKKMMTFIGSYDINAIKLWNETLKFTVLNNSSYVDNNYNIFNYFENIFEDGIKNGDFLNNIVMDKQKFNFTYFINKIDRVREIVHKVYQTILTDASLEKDDIIRLFPDFEDNFKFLYNETLKSKAKFKNVYIARLNNKKYGKYKKNSLINPRTHKLTPTFYTIAQETNRIMIAEHSKGNNIGLIIAMQEVYNHLKVKLKPTVTKYQLQVYFDYYYYLKGKNAYSNVNWITLFGSCNIPLQVREVMNRFWNISMDRLTDLFGPGTMTDGAHRGRALNRPNEINLYVFGNIERGRFNNEQNFYGILRIKHEKLLSYISREGGLTISEISDYVGKSEKPTRELLNLLLDNNILRWESKQIGKGRPKKIWKVI